MTGNVEVLSVGEGDITISFNSEDPAERIRAARIIKDVLKRGYILLAEVNGKYQRVFEFDENTTEYIIADFDPEAGDEKEPAEAKPKRKEKAKAKRKRVSAKSTKAVAISKTAGG